MRKGLREFWRRLGRVEKAFLLLAAIYFALRITGLSPTWQLFTALAVVVLGVVCLVRLTVSLMRKAIWRLRNRLIVAYLFIAVVPIFLIFTLAALACYVLIGQVGVYFVRTALANQEDRLLRQAETIAGVARPFGRRPGGGRFGGPGPGGGGPPPAAVAERGGGAPAAVAQPSGIPGRASPTGGRGAIFRGFGGFPPGTPQQPEESRAASGVRFARYQCENCEILATGREEIRAPAGSTLTHPPPEWGGRANGLIFKRDGDVDRLYVWAHVVGPGDVHEVTILWPLTADNLGGLEPRLNTVSINPVDGPPYVPWARGAHVPNPANVFDLPLRSWQFLKFSFWSSPTEEATGLLVLSSRISTVLDIIFQERSGQKWQMNDVAQVFFLAVIGLFLLVEIGSLWAGVKLTRTMTGAVHELYQGTQHVKEADFSYRIPVKGDDQLAELGSSFNTMTENLGRLIVVAKEKERLQSELEIAREVQNQLFPRDVPSSKTLELKGVCMPARVVSGDYYDFMAMPGSELAFAIGDVAGKGISAALLMATIQSTMRTQLSATNGATPKHFSAARLVAQLNRQLFANTTPEKYATFFFAIYDEAQHALTYTNAGHLPPILVRDGGFTNLNPTGTVVGAFPFAKYEERTVELQNGDIVVAYTDGIVEPENPYGEMFGENRMKDLVLRYAYAGSSEIIARTMEAVVQWTGSSELQDDMTMVVVRRV